MSRPKKQQFSPISGKHKRFSQEAYDRHDAAAVSAVQRHLDEEGEWARPNEDKYGPDLVIWQGFRPVRYVEVEQRSAWLAGEWPSKWDRVNIPERKLKNWQHGLPCDHWIISMDLKSALVISDYVFRTCGALEEFSNSVHASGELFLRVPLDVCEQYSIGPQGGMAYE